MCFFLSISVNLQTGFTLGGFLCEAGWYPAATTVHRFWFWGSHDHRHFHFHNYDITSKTLSFPQSVSCQSEKTQPGECQLDKMCPKIFVNLKYAPLQKITKATSMQAPRCTSDKVTSWQTNSCGLDCQKFLTLTLLYEFSKVIKSCK